MEIIESDIDDKTLLSCEVISKQATINIGVIGHVGHGKSTFVRSMTGVQTQRFQQEMERNMTIKLGYANAKIYKCDNNSCPRPGCYRSCGSSKEDAFPCDRTECMGKFKVLRHVSFLDCPGIHILLEVMRRSVVSMDAVVLMIAGNEKCPQPQILEHLACVEVVKPKIHTTVIQNKIDLIEKDEAVQQYKQILDTIKYITAEDSQVLPISAHNGQNIEAVCQAIVEDIPVPQRDIMSEPRLIVLRSFDINKPGCKTEDKFGGVVGGTLLRGVLKVGQAVEIRPGHLSKDVVGNVRCEPIRTCIKSLYSEQNSLQFAVPGGLIGVGTDLDPSLCQADKMVGSLLGTVGSLPDIYTEITISYILMKRVVGKKPENGSKPLKVQNLMKNELLLVTVGSSTKLGQVLAIKDDLTKLRLKTPVCADIGERVTFCRRINRYWRLIGGGEFRCGIKIDPTIPNGGEP